MGVKMVKCFRRNFLKTQIESESGSSITDAGDDESGRESGSHRKWYQWQKIITDSKKMP